MKVRFLPELGQPRYGRLAAVYAWEQGKNGEERKTSTCRKHQAPGKARENPIGPRSGPAENEPLHQPDYLLEDHPELGIPSMVQNGRSPKPEHRVKK
jgi:hypothetical protein